MGKLLPKPNIYLQDVYFWHLLQVVEGYSKESGLLQPSFPAFNNGEPTHKNQGDCDFLREEQRASIDNNKDIQM